MKKIMKHSKNRCFVFASSGTVKRLLRGRQFFQWVCTLCGRLIIYTRICTVSNELYIIYKNNYLGKFGTAVRFS